MALITIETVEEATCKNCIYVKQEPDGKLCCRKKLYLNMDAEYLLLPTVYKDHLCSSGRWILVVKRPDKTFTGVMSYVGIIEQLIYEEANYKGKP